MIIAAMHSCDENRSTQDTWQEQTAQYFADQGVNIVIGTGPHWLQPAAQLDRAGGGKTVVWYSLGNFLSSQIGSNALVGGIAVMNIDTRTHQVTKLGFMPTYMHYEWTAAQKASNDLLARHNLMVYPLDQASAAMANSQVDTTVPAQTQRVTRLMNRYTTVNMLTSSTFADF
jgi:poly-gamma-glutamate synthesis protein (capsule biosynthesis protein)